jgi:nickel-dependent lactate racemase
MDTVDIELRFGRDGVLGTRVPRSLLAAFHGAPEAIDDFDARLATALVSPLDFPALRQAVLADDHIVLALDRDTPHAAELIRGIWKVLSGQGLQPGHVLILQPAALTRHAQPDPRRLLPDDVREQIRWVRHDATAEVGHFAYLAATTAGDRVYLAREAVDADLVLPIGPICFDSVLGHRGTSSVLYPGLSKSDAISRAHGQGHDELGPADQRGIRQTIDEVGWLLGVQFAVQVIPGGGGDIADVIAGAQDAVFDEGKRRLDDHWRVTLDERVDFVVVAVEADEAGHDWAQVGAALDTARRLVTKDGRILVLSQLRGEVTPGLELLQNSRTPRDALQPLRTSAPEDLVAATQFARAADWAKVYLLSDLDDDVVEDLFAFPLGSVDEATRLIEASDRMAIIASAQHVYADVRSS